MLLAQLIVCLMAVGDLLGGNIGPIRCGCKCGNDCPNGYLLDSKGCPTCTCKPYPCPVLSPKCYCQYGYVVDSNGCRICKCLPPPCPSLNCTCAFGYVLDSRGCRTCTCVPPPCAELDCPPCMFGYEVDSHNCSTCICKPPSCITTPCSSECPKKDYTLDSNGCATCHCDWSNYCTPCPYPCPTVAGVITTARPGGNNGLAKRDVGPYGCPDCSLCAP